MPEWVGWVAWVLLFFLGVGLALAGAVLLFKGNVLDKAHPTEITWGDHKFSTTNIGIGAIGIGVILAAGMYLFKPDVAIKSDAQSVAPATVTVTRPLRAPEPTLTAPGVSTSTTATPSASPSPDSSCGTPSGPWSVESDGLRIVVTDVTYPVPRKLQFTLRVENNDSDSVNIDSHNVLVVDSNGKQYETEGLGFLGINVMGGQVVPAKMDLATQLQGSPATVELRFNLSHRMDGYKTFALCVPVPPQ